MGADDHIDDDNDDDDDGGGDDDNDGEETVFVVVDGVAEVDRMRLHCGFAAIVATIGVTMRRNEHNRPPTAPAAALLLLELPTGATNGTLTRPI